MCRETTLSNPEDVERFIFSLKVNNNYKNKLFEACQHFSNANGIAYRKPKKLQLEPYVIHVPTEQRIDLIITSCRWVYTTVFNLSKYGLRPDEVSKLTLRNIDLEHGKLTVPASKLGVQRTLQLKPHVRELLKNYVTREGITTIDHRLFAGPRKIKAIGAVSGSMLPSGLMWTVPLQSTE